MRSNRKYISLISPTKNGGYYVMFSEGGGFKKNISPYSSSHIEEVELLMRYFDNLDDFDPDDVANMFERQKSMGNVKKGSHKVYKTYEFYDENGDFMAEQPTHLINFRSGMLGYMDSDLISDTVKHHISDKKYFELVNQSIIERSENALQLDCIHAEMEDRKTHKYLTVQFKVVPKPVQEEIVP